MESKNGVVNLPMPFIRQIASPSLTYSDKLVLLYPNMRIGDLKWDNFSLSLVLNAILSKRCSI